MVGMFTRVCVGLNFQNHLGLLIPLSDIQKLALEVRGSISKLGEAVLLVLLEHPGQEGSMSSKS